MNATERLQITIGRLAIENATLAARVEELEAECARLKSLKEPNDSKIPDKRPDMG